MKSYMRTPAAATALLLLILAISSTVRGEKYTDVITTGDLIVRNGNPGIDAPTARGSIVQTFTINDRSNRVETIIDVRNEISNKVYLTDEFIDGDVLCIYTCVRSKCMLFHYTIDFIKFAIDVDQKEVPEGEDPWYAMGVDLDNKHPGSTF